MHLCRHPSNRGTTLTAKSHRSCRRHMCSLPVRHRFPSNAQGTRPLPGCEQSNGKEGAASTKAINWTQQNSERALIAPAAQYLPVQLPSKYGSDVDGRTAHSFCSLQVQPSQEYPAWHRQPKGTPACGGAAHCSLAWRRVAWRGEAWRGMVVLLSGALCHAVPCCNVM